MQEAALLRRIHHTFHISNQSDIPELAPCFVSEVAGNTIPPHETPPCDDIPDFQEIDVSD